MASSSSLLDETKRNNVAGVTRLIEAGADLDARDARSLTALHYAVERNAPDLVELLIKNNADPNVKDKDNAFTPLHRAVILGYLRCVEALMQSGKGANVELLDAQGLSPMVYAERSGRDDIVKALNVRKARNPSSRRVNDPARKTSGGSIAVQPSPASAAAAAPAASPLGTTSSAPIAVQQAASRSASVSSTPSSSVTGSAANTAMNTPANTPTTASTAASTAASTYNNTPASTASVTPMTSPHAPSSPTNGSPPGRIPVSPATTTSASSSDAAEKPQPLPISVVPAPSSPVKSLPTSPVSPVAKPTAPSTIPLPVSSSAAPARPAPASAPVAPAAAILISSPRQLQSQSPPSQPSSYSSPPLLPVNLSLSEGALLSRKEEPSYALPVRAAPPKDPQRSSPINIVKRLGLGRNKDRSVVPPSIAAAKANNATELLNIFNKGEAVDTRDADGNTPLYVATEIGSVQCVAMCIERNADINAANDNGWTPLHAAVFGTQKEHEIIAGMLIESGALINVANNNNETPLQVATRRNASREILRLLKRATVNLCVSDVRKLITSGTLEGDKVSSLQLVLDHLDFVQSELETQKRTVTQLTLSLDAANDVMSKSIVNSVHATTLSSSPPVPAPSTQRQRLPSSATTPSSSPQLSSASLPSHSFDSASVDASSKANCYNCVQNTYQITALNIANDELTARVKKLMAAIAKNTDGYEKKLKDAEAGIRKSEEERKATIEELESSKSRLESAYMNKLTKMSQEMEVAMRQIQNELVEADQTRQDILSSQLKSRKITWVPDKFVTVCLGCSKRFDNTLRKHHCRCCGRVYCSNCSSKKTALPSLGFKQSVRVCDSCFMLASTTGLASSSSASDFGAGGDDDNGDAESDDFDPKKGRGVKSVLKGGGKR